MSTVQITAGFWHDRMATNAARSIFHQWQQLEASGCIENFRISAGDVAGFREGWFFADSDAHKWLDAAARIYATQPDPKLNALMDNFINLLEHAQMPDGYLYTYNQIHFPATRWINLQIEHELYCHGHLIEAGVSHFESSGQTRLLAVSRRAADRIVQDFLGKGPEYTPGHQQIEIALLRLYQLTTHTPYLDMARQFIEQRGRIPGFAGVIIKEYSSVGKREKEVRRQKKSYLAEHPEYKPYQLPPGNKAKRPWNTTLRWYASALSGNYFQQHAPVRQQTIPVGHSVRFAYLQTAIARLARIRGERTFIPALKQAWQHMVDTRMYVTGGIGSLPALEGFGRDYELDPQIAYTETCAALGSMSWNWEMARLTGAAKFSDLFEWQLYNAAAVGMGLDGTSYFYNNPLCCRGGVTRKPWYAVPCCPSNISRTWANLAKVVFSQDEQEIRIHQYFSSHFENDGLRIEVHSELPWTGKVSIHILTCNRDDEFTISLRLPSWRTTTRVTLNQKLLDVPAPSDPAATASGFDPGQSEWLPVQRSWAAGDRIGIEFDLSIRLRHAHPKVKGLQGKVAVTRGPLVYCLESNDNKNADIFSTHLDPHSLDARFCADTLGGIIKINAHSTQNQKLTFIPYHLWGNRGHSQMTVRVNT